MSFLGRSTVYFHCSCNCRCQIKILGHIQKHCLYMETGSLVTGGGISAEVFLVIVRSGLKGDRAL